MATPQKDTTKPNPYLTTKEVAAQFGVNELTVYNWRQGSPRRDPLPAHEKTTKGDTRKRIFFKRSEVKAWAAKHGVKPKSV